MRALRRFAIRLAAPFLRNRDEERLRAEIEQHLTLEAEENLRRGLTAEEARRQAALKFGGVEAMKEDYRDRRSLPLFETVPRDIRYALRRLRKTPAFTLTTIATLALGIGATTAIFTLVNAILLKSLPVSNPEQLYRLGKESHCCVWGGYNQEAEFSIVSYELYQYLRDHTQGFEEIAAFQADGAFLGMRRAQTASAAESRFGEFVSGNYFSMFGVPAYAGRTLTMEDDRPGAPAAAMMSYRVWQQHYGSDPAVIGGAFLINNQPFTVVGVTPPGFFGDTLKSLPPDFFLPLAMEPRVQGDSSLLRKADTHWLEIIGRVRSGANVGSIEAQMRLELSQWLRSHESEMEADERLALPRQTLNLAPGGAGIAGMRRQYEQWLKILVVASAVVLLIVCANVANLMLVRGMERRQQTSLSVALGAKPSRLFQQALTESVLLSLAGGTIGLGIAFAGTRLILHFAFSANTAVPISASPSAAVGAFAFAVSLLTGGVFGVAPAWMATRADPAEALRGANRATRQSGALPRKTLVVLQTALSLVLLSASGLLTGALRNLEGQSFGFTAEGRTVVTIDPVLAGYKPEQLELLYRRIHDSFLSLPGVIAESSGLHSPLSGSSWNELAYVEGKPEPASIASNASWWVRVTPGYFDAIGNPIVRGRPIGEQDTASSRHVAVINEAFARKFFQGEDPIGKHFGKFTIQYAGDYEVVGVAKDARYLPNDLDKPVGPFFFLPESQWTEYTQATFHSTEVRSHYLRDVVVRSASGTTLMEAQARRAMAGVDPNLPIIRMRTLPEQVAGTFGQQRLIARLTSLFGALALVLASVGVYGITAFNAASRTSEMGVRMALGAARGDVMALILKGAFLMIGAGLVVGVPLTLAAGRLLGHQLYGINQYDPVILSVSVAALVVPGLAAALVPALRASSISPVRALRAE